MRGMARLLTSELWDGPRPRCFRVPCPRRHARAHAPATLVQADDARDEQEGGAEEGESSQAVSELGFWEGADPDLEPLEPELQPEGGGVLGDEGGGGDAGGGGGGGGNAGGDGRTRPGARDSVWWGWNKRGRVRIDLPNLPLL